MQQVSLESESHQGFPTFLDLYHEVWISTDSVTYLYLVENSPVSLVMGDLGYSPVFIAHGRQGCRFIPLPPKPSQYHSIQWRWDTCRVSSSLTRLPQGARALIQGCLGNFNSPLKYCCPVWCEDARRRNWSRGRNRKWKTKDHFEHQCLCLPRNVCSF